jgi:exosortase C (VPDSG-CTERM-specific)
MVTLAAGAGFAMVALFASPMGLEVGHHDYLSAAMAGFISCGVAGGFLFLGKAALKPHAFAIAFLVFAIPIPAWGVNALEMFFQHTSAEAAAVMIEWSGIPMLRDGLVFQLPGLTIQVAQECSGLRSSIVLFITSVLAGAVVLQKPWARGLLALAVIPLGIIRNGFRILTLSLLCVHLGPEMIDSPIHHQGGPLFFALSLVPFFGLLIWLRKLEKRATRKRTENVAN